VIELGPDGSSSNIFLQNIRRNIILRSDYYFRNTHRENPKPYKGLIVQHMKLQSGSLYE